MVAGTPRSLGPAKCSLPSVPCRSGAAARQGCSAVQWSHLTQGGPMFDPQDVPLPPELASPDGDADAWVSQLAAHAVMISEDAGTDPDFVGRDLAGGIMPGEAPEAARRWTVTGDGEAEWAMR